MCVCVCVSVSSSSLSSCRAVSADLADPLSTLSSIAPGMSSRLYSVSAQSYCL